jgi:hypothetical protein
VLASVSVERPPPTQAAEGIEHKHRNFGDAVVLAMHRARGGAQAAAAGVFETFAGLQVRLLAHHAIAFDFFRHAIGIVDVPCAGNELGGDITRVGDRDGVGESKDALRRRRLLRDVLRTHGDGELGTAHA